MRFSLLIFSTFAVFTQGCSQSGGCCKSRTPPPVTCGQSQCQQGYGCGQYGCARRKAFGGLTRRIDGVLVNDEVHEQAELAEASSALRPHEVSKNVSIERLMNPNFIFRSCCEARGLPDSCLRHCHFNTYTFTTIEAMFNKVDKCPIEAINEIHYCAAQGIDHRECCNSNGISNTAAGQKCLSFCDQRPNRFTPIDASYLPCYEVFEGMKQCFYQEIRIRAQKKFKHSEKYDFALSLH
ncbi:hypothetical protein GCK72_009609 [Caenorhabditis remanei]|uniref:Domain of unknown function DB domain-containing protein n=1 Tax=Caenorhabditis remanei TaxID=31234 RepID=E3LRX3_CAERE|nr:hypothetical protein GCK72_009609 [Caenorhabditis remanei]EFP09119.1 hypothetical protein CRE_25207 [Caenorhabditis remanei]KAF1761353.1 hypothetical protein GCK72_009609 [Caenorhabditis remanei]